MLAKHHKNGICGESKFLPQFRKNNKFPLLIEAQQATECRHWSQQPLGPAQPSTLRSQLAIQTGKKQIRKRRPSNPAEPAGKEGEETVTTELTSHQLKTHSALSSQPSHFPSPWVLMPRTSYCGSILNRIPTSEEASRERPMPQLTHCLQYSKANYLPCPERRPLKPNHMAQIPAPFMTGETLATYSVSHCPYFPIYKMEWSWFDLMWFSGLNTIREV